MIENKYLEYYIFLGDFFSESMKKGSGGRITSLTLEKKGGWEGGREREGVARRCDGKRCGSGRGGIRRADGWGHRTESGGVANRSAAAGGGGSSPHCARSSCRRRLDPAAMAAAAAAAAPFRPQAAAPRLLPIRRGHGNPATASVPRDPPPPSTAPARPSSHPSPLLGALSGSVRALPPVRIPVSGCGVGSSSLPSFLPSFVTRPGRRQRRRRHKPAFARVGGCSV